jgi:uncharacterized glyoxalase superfamily protein PhnB
MPPQPSTSTSAHSARWSGFVCRDPTARASCTPAFRSAKLLKGTPVTIHLQVENVDELYARAIAAGGTVKMSPADMFWGDRYGVLIDPFGHQWSIATHKQNLTTEQIAENAKAMFASPDCK